MSAFQGKADMGRRNADVRVKRQDIGGPAVHGRQKLKAHSTRTYLVSSGVLHKANHSVRSAARRRARSLVGSCSSV